MADRDDDWTQFPPIEGDPAEGPGWLSVLVIIGLFVLAAWTLS
jgi:hypothetical protein